MIRTKNLNVFRFLTHVWDGIKKTDAEASVRFINFNIILDLLTLWVAILSILSRIVQYDSLLNHALHETSQ